ncbi:MAG: hypothetical protein RJA44_108, partial [Pseudomonadota bacterium]
MQTLPLSFNLQPLPRRWPALREELQLHHAPALPDGQPSWTLHDPVRHRFLRIDWLSYEVLRHWWLADPGHIAERINQQTTLAIEPAHVEQVLAWALQEELLQPVSPAARPPRPQGAAGAAQWLLHHYLFFRIPLFNPDRLLDRLHPQLQRLGSR